MSPRRFGREDARLQFAELLEPRHLLAGVVQVDFLEGDLLVTGDELANVFVVEQVADPGGLRNSLLITPDADTAINGLPAGVAFNLGPVEVVNVRIVSGDGADEVGVRGLSIEGGLEIENIGGSDLFAISSSSIGRDLRIDSTPSRSKADLSDVSIARTLDKSTPILLQPVCTGKNVDINAIDLKCGGSAKWELYRTAGSIDLSRVEIDGGLTVVSRDALSQLTVSESRVGAANKATPILVGSLDTHNTNVIASSTHVHGSAEMKFDRDGGAVELTAMAIDGRLHISTSSGRGTATLSDITIARTADKATPKLQQACSTGNFDVKATLVSVGGSMQTSFKDNKSGGKVTIVDSQIDGELRVDGDGILHVSAADTTVSENLSFNYSKIELHQRERSSLELRGLDVGGSLRVESSQPLDVTLEQSTAAAVDMFLKLPPIKGEAAQASHVVIADVDLDGRLDVVSVGPLDLSIAGTTARGGYIKLGSIKGEATDNKHKNEIDILSFHSDESLRVEADVPTALSISNSTVGGETQLIIKMKNVLVSSYSIGGSTLGSLRVDSSGIVNGSVEETTASESLSFNYSKIEFSKVPGENSSLDLRGLDVGGSLQVESSQPLDLSVGQTTAASVDYFLKLDGIKGESAATTSSLSFSDVRIAGGLTISGSRASESVRLERVHVGGVADIRLDGGNDSLMVIDSVFAGPALFDGGSDFDVLTLAGAVFEQGRVLRNWEEILEPPPAPTDDGDVIVGEVAGQTEVTLPLATSGVGRGRAGARGP